MGLEDPAGKRVWWQSLYPFGEEPIIQQCLKSSEYEHCKHQKGIYHKKEHAAQQKQRRLRQSLRQTPEKHAISCGIAPVHAKQVMQPCTGTAFNSKFYRTVAQNKNGEVWMNTNLDPIGNPNLMYLF